MHKEIANILERNLSQDCRLIRDKACGGNQHIPLFYSTKKSRETEYCNIDLLVLKENKIRLIVEIEESDIKPTQICGKILTSALARYYIHKSEDNKPIEMDESVTFLQIVDTSGLVKDKTKKFKQWDVLEKSINGILPLKNSQIKTYKLINTDDLKQLKTFIRTVCAE